MEKDPLRGVGVQAMPKAEGGAKTLIKFSGIPSLNIKSHKRNLKQYSRSNSSNSNTKFNS